MEIIGYYGNSFHYYYTLSMISSSVGKEGSLSSFFFVAFSLNTLMISE